MAMPAGTPARIATPTATLTIDRCSSVRSPIAGRLCRMNVSVSIDRPGSAGKCFKRARVCPSRALLADRAEKGEQRAVELSRVFDLRNVADATQHFEPARRHQLRDAPA